MTLGVPSVWATVSMSFHLILLVSTGFMDFAGSGVVHMTGNKNLAQLWFILGLGPMSFVVEIQDPGGPQIFGFRPRNSEIPCSYETFRLATKHMEQKNGLSLFIMFWLTWELIMPFQHG